MIDEQMCVIGTCIRKTQSHFIHSKTKAKWKARKIRLQFSKCIDYKPIDIFIGWQSQNSNPLNATHQFPASFSLIKIRRSHEMSFENRFINERIIDWWFLLCLNQMRTLTTFVLALCDTVSRNNTDLIISHSVDWETALQKSQAK